MKTRLSTKVEARLAGEEEPRLCDPSAETVLRGRRHRTRTGAGPSALDPEAPNQTPGAGGTPSSVGLCDHIPRFVQGVGNVTLGTAFTDRDEEMTTTLGVLWDASGDDFYRGVIVPDYPPAPGTGEGEAAGSQGFGGKDGKGTFYDGGGTDTYEGVPDRANDTIVESGRESTGTGGRFVDEAGGDGPVPAIVSTLLPAP